MIEAIGEDLGTFRSPELTLYRGKDGGEEVGFCYLIWTIISEMTRPIRGVTGEGVFDY